MWQRGVSNKAVDWQTQAEAKLRKIVRKANELKVKWTPRLEGIQQRVLRAVKANHKDWDFNVLTCEQASNDGPQTPQGCTLGSYPKE